MDVEHQSDTTRKENLTMRISKWKRAGSGLLAAVIAASVYVGAAVPAAAAAVGDDGSAEMNEAYAAHESLMPVGPSFNVDTLLEWTPESDPDARYSLSLIHILYSLLALQMRRCVTYGCARSMRMER